MPRLSGGTSAHILYNIALSFPKFSVTKKIESMLYNISAYSIKPSNVYPQASEEHPPLEGANAYPNQPFPVPELSDAACDVRGRV